MEGFSPPSISRFMQAELSRRMLEDIERIFTQDGIQAGAMANGRTHAAV